MFMTTKPVISVVLGTYNRLSFLKLTIESIRAGLENLSREIFVIDGGSTDGTTQWLIKQKDIVTMVQHNRGKWNGKPIERRSWGYFMNLGFRSAQGKYVCMLSDDCLVVPGAIINGYNLFEEELAKGKKVGAVAFYWRNWPEQEKYWVGITLGNKMFVNHGMYLKRVLEDVNYIDEETYHFYHADGDLCLKLWQNGYECIDSPNSYVEHYSHANKQVRTSNLDKQKKDWNNYLNKWKGIFYDDKLNNIGGWLEKEFDDNSKSYKKFESIGKVTNILHAVEKIRRFIRLG